jgi:(R,R)-butanediol dehydrogenase/meso-butanediol dehydrogenase/diacetyl reductase
MAGVQETFTFSLDILRSRGEVIIPALPTVPLGVNVISLIRREASIRGSQCTIDEFTIVPELIAKGTLDVKGVITKKIFLDDIVKEGFETMIADKSQLKILVTPKRENI